MSQNPELSYTLEQAVGEVLTLLTGLDLEYSPDTDRFRAISVHLNRATRLNALEQEWGYYATMSSFGEVVEGDTEFNVPRSLRPRQVNDDAARLVNADGRTVRWLYFLPKDALHKYQGRQGLWCSFWNGQLHLSRPIHSGEDNLELIVPVMREPRMVRLPDQGVSVPATITDQLIDFPYPDVIVARAAYLYAQTDPVMQPRAQTLQAEYKDLMYQVMERDNRNTDAPTVNPVIVPVDSGITGSYMSARLHMHPHAE